MVVLAATDPAQPYGASLRWPDVPGRPARAAGAHVILVDGDPALFVERGAKSVVAFDAAHASDRWVEGLKDLVRNGTIRTLEIAKIDGEAAAESPLSHVLLERGFIKGYKGLTFISR